MSEGYQESKRIRLYQTGSISFPNININKNSTNQCVMNKINDINNKIISMHNEIKIIDSKLNYIGTTTNCIVNKVNTFEKTQDVITNNIEILNSKIDKIQNTINKICDKLNNETIKLNETSLIPDDMMNSYYG